MNSLYNLYFKRGIDFIVALCAIILLTPIFILVGLLIRTKLGSPIIFKQPRPGLNGKIFTMYKFRSMNSKVDEKGNLLPDKDRLTTFGKLLRATSLDELPGLFNILKGEMSLVGPRPLSVKYLPYYNEFESQRHNVRPGLTGLAQINGRNTVEWEKRFEYDVYYVKNLSFTFDLLIILKTFIKVLKRDGVAVRGTTKNVNFHEYRMKQNGNYEKR